MKIKILIGLALVVSASLVVFGFQNCSGGGGGGSGVGVAAKVPGLNISGTVSSGFAPTTSARLDRLNLFESTAWAGLPGFSPIASAHVNVCYFNNGALTVLPGHPTILAGSSGNFNISVTYRDAQTYGPNLFVCATDPGGSLLVVRPVPNDLLPQDSNQVTTVALNPDLNGTVIAQFACSSQVLFFSGKQCNILTQAQITNLDNAITAFFNTTNLSGIVDANHLNTFIDAMSNTPGGIAAINAYCQQVSNLPLPSCYTGASGSSFSPVNTPLPPPTATSGKFDGSFAGTFGGSCPPPAGSVGGGFTMIVTSGAITGAVNGAGGLTGAVDVNGTAAVGGAVGGTPGCTFSGAFTAGPPIHASGSWSCPNGCAGGWSF